MIIRGENNCVCFSFFLVGYFCIICFLLLFFFWSAGINVKTMSFFGYFILKALRACIYVHLTVTQGKPTLHALLYGMSVPKFTHQT